MTFTCGVIIVGSRILVVACHAVGSCVNCDNTTLVNIIDLALTCTTAIQIKALYYSIVGHSPSYVGRVGPRAKGLRAVNV